MTEKKPAKRLTGIWRLGLCIAVTAALCAGVARYVDLKPQVDEHFFFSAKDPLYQTDREIAKIFSQTPQLIIAAKGDIASPEYAVTMERMSADFEKLPLVLGLQSLVRGPDGLKDAKKSPLWERTILSTDGKASFILLFLKDNPDSAFIEKLEEICRRHKRADIEIIISGVPYIVELVRRSLFRDLKIFSLAAFTVFSLVLLVMFRSVWIVGGVIASCLSASSATMLLARFLDLKTGFLTANLPTIVFVLTLSNIAFLTAEWRRLMSENAAETAGREAWQAAKITFGAACWSTMTALLGFLTLFFVQAESLRQLGLSGSIGTLSAFAAAYGIYPWFLMRQNRHPAYMKLVRERTARSHDFWLRPHKFIMAVLAIFAVAGLMGVPKLQTDPSLFEYFKKGSILRSGLEYIDENGGSNPLMVVIRDPEHKKLNDGEAFKKMWRLHTALEKDPAVGSVVSLPLMLAEAKRSFMAKFLTYEWIVDIMSSPRFGEVAKYFITPDRDRSLFLLRMKEGASERPRLAAVARIEKIVRENGYAPALTGGVFLLQGRLSQLISASLISGSALLNIVILTITFYLTRSWRVAFAMLVSLYFVPAVMLGILGWLRIPLDVIAAPAANIALGMGVDSMIHMAVRARATGKSVNSMEAWADAAAQLWDPILWSTVMVASGFSIFLLSDFPPTQRFGFSVVLGTVLSPFATLCILPALAVFSWSGALKGRPAADK